MPDAGPVNLDADEICRGFLVRHAGQRVAIAEPDFQGAWRLASETGIEIKAGIRLQSIARPEACQRLFLGAGNPSFTAHEGVDGSHVRMGGVQAAY